VLLRSAVLLLLVPFAVALPTGPNSYRPRIVDWAGPMFVPAFPAGQPPPQAVILRYQRWSSASGRVENVADRACGVVFEHQVQMQLSLPGGRLLDVSSRTGSEARLLAAYDGLEDFDGTSGLALSSIAGDTTYLVLDDPADIAHFAGGGGGVSLWVLATGQAVFTGPSTLRQEVEVRAGARLTVEYVPGAP